MHLEAWETKAKVFWVWAGSALHTTASLLPFAELLYGCIGLPWNWTKYLNNILFCHGKLLHTIFTASIKLTYNFEAKIVNLKCSTTNVYNPLPSPSPSPSPAFPSETTYPRLLCPEPSDLCMFSQPLDVQNNCGRERTTRPEPSARACKQRPTRRAYQDRRKLKAIRGNLGKGGALNKIYAARMH